MLRYQVGEGSFWDGLSVISRDWLHSVCLCALLSFPRVPALPGVWTVLRAALRPRQPGVRAVRGVCAASGNRTPAYFWSRGKAKKGKLL